MIVLIVSSTIAIVVSFLCSLAEALLLSLNPLTLHRLEATHPHACQSWKRLKKNVAYPITAILVLNTVAHTGGATVAGGAFLKIFGENRIWIFSVVFTLIILLGTEIFPKILGVTFRNRLAPVAGPLLESVTLLMRPFIVLSEFMFKGLKAEQESDQITTADLITLASLAKSGKAIHMEQENMIVNVVRLAHTPVGSVMIPPEKIHFLRSDADPESIHALAEKCGHTRYPVSSSSEVKDIYGFIQIKRIVPATRDALAALLANPEPLNSVSQDEPLLTALRSMLLNKKHLHSVTDEQGHCVGIVTLEDIASELLSADIEVFK